MMGFGMGGVRVNIDAVSSDLETIDGVQDVHDLHLWTLTSGMHVATAHLVAATGAPVQPILDSAQKVLRDRHGVAHATLQVEPGASQGCKELDW